MHFSKVKIPLIIFLIFLAIYQTSGLWFETYSSHNLFYLINKKFDKKLASKDILCTAESLFINEGNGKIIRKYNNLDKLDYKNIFDKIISFCLQNASIKYNPNFNIDDVLNQKSVIYNFAYDVLGKDLQTLFSVKNSKLEHIKSFNMIALIPSDDNYVKIIFIDKNTNTSNELKLYKNSININIKDTIAEISRIISDNFYFISTKKSGISLFNQNEYLPKSISRGNSETHSNITLNDITYVNPLENDGGVLLSESENYINIFFENPAVKITSFIKDTYTYNDDNTVVKYYTNGVLDYSNYKTSFDAVKDSNYKIATAFLNEDTNIKNEYYLNSYKIKDNIVTFYFDYKIGNLPIILTDSLKHKIDMSSMIEVSVENGRVSKYRRFIYDFYTLDTKTTVENSFINAIDNTLVKLGLTFSKNIFINDMDLIYKFDNITMPIPINWEIKINGNKYFEDVYTKNNGG